MDKTSSLKKLIPIQEQSGMDMIKRILGDHIAPYKGKIIIALIFMVVSGAMSGLFAMLVEPVIDRVLSPEQDAFTLLIVGGVWFSFVFRGVGGYISAVKMIEVGQGVVADLQKRIFAKLLSLDLAYFSAHTSGSLQSRVINDINIMRIAVVDTMMGLGKSLITVIALVAVMFYQDWQLTLISIVTMPIIIYAMAKIGRLLRKVSKETQDQQAGLAGYLTQIFQGIRQIKSYNAQTHEKERSAKQFDDLRDLNIKSVRYSTLSMPINDFLVACAIVGLLMYGAWSVSEGRLTAGELLSFITAFLLAYEPIKKLARLNGTLQLGLGASERIFDIIDHEITIKDPKRPEPLPPAPYKIEFKNVTFGYASDEPAITSLNLIIKAGEKVALVGPSGGGKTTILNLIPRFYDPQAGQILVNDVALMNVKKSSWRDHVALVSQDITLFDDSVAGNIRFGQKNITQEGIEKAAKAANAHQFIQDLPNGYGTLLGENGMRLSGGQRQRIALARAILKDAPVLLLDEATSALDNESEVLIQKALDQFSKGRTVITIAHRLSTIQNSDRIIVIQGGQIAEQGSHDVLLAQNGLYAQLYKGNNI